MTAYTLGVDLGTTYTAAAIGRGGQVSPLQLGAEGAVVPSVVVVRDDGEVLVGDAAERRASAEPARSAREFKRRLGDPVPLIVAGQPYTVEALMGYQLREIVRRATEQEGEAPASIVLTHPANYTDFKLGKLREVAEEAGLAPAGVVLLAEPEAAAIAYTRDQRVEVGDVIAVYDFGGGTFDAALVRRTDVGFELIGIPEGMERLGGIDFDQAVLAHVDQAVGGLVTGADRADPATIPAQARLRVDCRRAKEALSTDSDTTIPVALPGLQTDVRLTRAELEAMVRPRIAQTVSALERTVASAGLTMADVSRVLLVGGTSRMPVVAEMIRSATGRPVGLDAHPKLAIATGAALAGASTLPVAPTTAQPEWQAPTRVVPVTAAPEPSGGGAKKFWIIGIVAAVVALVAVLAITNLSGSDDEPTPSSPGSTVAEGSVPAEVTTPASVVPTEAPPASGPADSEPPASAPPETPSPTTAAPPAGDDVTDVATLSGQPVGLAANGAAGLVAATVDSAVVGVAADGELTSLGNASGVPGGVAVAPAGDVVVSTPAGIVNVVDGSVVLDGAIAGLGTTPGPLAFDGVGNLYIADNDNNRIVRQGTDGSLNLVAGNGSDPGDVPAEDGLALDVAIGRVTGLAIDQTGRLLIGDAGTRTVRAVAGDGSITTVVGGGTVPVDAADGVPAGTGPRDVQLGGVSGLAVSAASGGLAVSDDSQHVILVVDADGTVSVVVGPGGSSITTATGVLGPVVITGNELTFTDGDVIRRITRR